LVNLFKYGFIVGSVRHDESHYTKNKAVFVNANVKQTTKCTLMVTRKQNYDYDFANKKYVALHTY